MRATRVWFQAYGRHVTGKTPSRISSRNSRLAPAETHARLKRALAFNRYTTELLAGAESARFRRSRITVQRPTVPAYGIVAAERERAADAGDERLCPYGRMCYNRAAVESAVMRELSSMKTQAPEAATDQAAEPREDASRYCPVCSQRLESRRCKLICPICGYYMSCADYY